MAATEAPKVVNSHIQNGYRPKAKPTGTAFQIPKTPVKKTNKLDKSISDTLQK